MFYSCVLKQSPGFSIDFLKEHTQTDKSERFFLRKKFFRIEILIEKVSGQDRNQLNFSLKRFQVFYWLI